MTSISVSELKKHCTRLLRDEVARDHESLLVTSRSKPIAKVVPVSPSGRHPAWGYLKGRVERMTADFNDALGDEEWEAAR